MEALGPDEELAAVSLGANGWQMFWHITVPNIKWGLIYGIFSATPAQWGNSARFTWFPATLPVRPTLCLCGLKSYFKNMISRRLLPLHLSADPGGGPHPGCKNQARKKDPFRG